MRSRVEEVESALSSQRAAKLDAEKHLTMNGPDMIDFQSKALSFRGFFSALHKILTW